MKFISSQFVTFLGQRGARRNIEYLLRFLLMLLLLIALFTVLFHYIMEYEGRSFSWITGVYWTLTVMSTLGFGDITFTSDLGRFFSIVVLLSGVIFLLVMLPFTFIQYFYAPWLEAQKKQQTPRKVPPGTQGHVILVGITPITLNLVDDLLQYGVRCVLLCPDGATTLDLIDQGYEAVMGEYDNGNVYRRLQVSSAAMVVALDSDVRNTNIVFTVREVDSQVPIVTRVEQQESVDILELAGATRVFQFHKLLGEALARRVIGGHSRCSVISRFEGLVVAEAPAMRTFLVGRTPRTCGLRSSTGVNVVGLWERGVFRLPGPDTIFTDATVLVVAGTEQQVAAFDTLLRKDVEVSQSAPVVVLGGGRVGLAAALQLNERHLTYEVVDKSARRNVAHSIQGDAADLAVLEQAGIRDAPSVIITTHDDDTNIYLTLYCRRLRPDIQIICRASLDRNVGILHAAGADLVLSLASMMTNSVINLLSPGKVFMLNEGLNMFRSHVRGQLVGKTLMDSGIRRETNCSVVGVRLPDDTMLVNPNPDHLFVEGEDIYLIGDSAAQKLFYEKYGRDPD